MTLRRATSGTFVVSTRLGVELFDDPRQARRCLAEVMAEVHHLRNTDHRIRRARIRRIRGSKSRAVELTIAAPSGWQAFEIGSAVVRAAIHAVGGTTAGWEGLRPELSLGAAATPLRRPGPHASWAELSAAALASMPTLPPMRPAVAGPLPRRLVDAGVIDLR